jgi:hypothetical protein
VLLSLLLVLLTCERPGLPLLLLPVLLLLQGRLPAWCKRGQKHAIAHRCRRPRGR